MKFNYKNLKEWQVLKGVRNIDLTKEDRKCGSEIAPIHVDFTNKRL